MCPGLLDSPVALFQYALIGACQTFLRACMASVRHKANHYVFGLLEADRFPVAPFTTLIRSFFFDPLLVKFSPIFSSPVFAPHPAKYDASEFLRTAHPSFFSHTISRRRPTLPPLTSPPPPIPGCFAPQAGQAPSSASCLFRGLFLLNRTSTFFFSVTPEWRLFTGIFCFSTPTFFASQCLLSAVQSVEG